MRKLIIVILILLIALISVVPVLAAHNVGPCNDSGEPGNSDYAQHHIVPADLGHGAHIPGSHGGYSVCLGTGRVFHQP